MTWSEKKNRFLCSRNNVTIRYLYMAFIGTNEQCPFLAEKDISWPVRCAVWSVRSWLPSSCACQTFPPRCLTQSHIQHCDAVQKAMEASEGKSKVQVKNIFYYAICLKKKMKKGISFIHIFYMLFDIDLHLLLFLIFLITNSDIQERGREIKK